MVETGNEGQSNKELMKQLIHREPKEPRTLLLLVFLFMCRAFLHIPISHTISIDLQKQELFKVCIRQIASLWDKDVPCKRMGHYKSIVTIVIRNTNNVTLHVNLLYCREPLQISNATSFLGEIKFHFIGFTGNISTFVFIFVEKPHFLRRRCRLDVFIPFGTTISKKKLENREISSCGGP